MGGFFDVVFNPFDVEGDGQHQRGRSQHQRSRPYQGVAANHAGQQHCGHLRAQARHQAEVFIREIRKKSKWKMVNRES